MLVAFLFKDNRKRKQKEKKIEKKRRKEEEDRSLRDTGQYIYLLIFCSCGVFLSLLAMLYKLISLQYNLLQRKSINCHI